MIRLFKYEGYKVTISEEALLLKPFKAIWDRDRTKSKDRALDELGFIYFFCDPGIVTGKQDRKSTRLNSSHSAKSRMPSSA